MTAVALRRCVFVVLLGVFIGLPLAAHGDDTNRAFILTAIKANFRCPIEWIRLRELATNKNVTIYQSTSPEYILIEVLPGRYNVSNIQTQSWGAKYDDAKALCEVLPGTITYIGDIVIGDNSKPAGHILYRHDLSEQTIGLAYKSNEALFDQLPTNIALPGMAPQLVNAREIATKASPSMPVHTAAP